MKKNLSLCLAAAILWSAAAPAAPAFAAEIEGRAPVALTGAPAALQPAALPGAMALPTSSISEVPGGAATSNFGLPAAETAAQAAPEAQPAYARESVAASVETAAYGETKDAPVTRSLIGRLRAALRTHLAGTVLFDASATRSEISPSAVGVTGLRPLPAPSIKGLRLDQPPTLPVAHRNLGFTASPSNSIQLPIAPINESTVENALRRFVDSEPARFKVSSKELKTVHVKFMAGHGDQADSYFATFVQAKDGLAIDGSGLTVMVKVINGLAEVVDVDAHLFPTLTVDTGAKLNDDELKQKAEQKLQLPQSGNPEYTLLGRKILFLGAKWRAVNVYAVANVKEARGIMVAVDVATGESFAWDARHGVMLPGIQRGPSHTNNHILAYRGPLADEQVESVKAALKAAGIEKVKVNQLKAVKMTLILVEGSNEAAIKAALDGLALKPFSITREQVYQPANAGGLQPVAAEASGEAHATAENKDTRPNGQPELIEQSLPHLNVTVGGEETQTDADGKFTASKDGAFSASLEGKWAAIHDDAGQPVKIVGDVKAGQPNIVIARSASDDLLTLNQLNMYIWISRIHDWWSQRLGGDKRIDQQIPVNVNINDECNAYYTPGTPSLNFFKESSRCSDTGRPGVGAHEYGHFVDDMLGGILNGGMSEGWGDIGSMFLLGTPIIGDGFLKGQNPSYIRHGENNYQYNKWDEVHAQGQAWMGFAWKLRKALIAKLGEAEGSKAVESLIIPTIFTKARDIPGQMAKVLLNATTKDGSILHEAEIRAAAKAHGITLPGDKGSLTIQSASAGSPVGFNMVLRGDGSLISVRRFRLDGDAAAVAKAKEEALRALSLAHIDYRDLKWEITGGGSHVQFRLQGSRQAVDYMAQQIERLTKAIEGPAARRFPTLTFQKHSLAAGGAHASRINLAGDAQDIETYKIEAEGLLQIVKASHPELTWRMAPTQGGLFIEAIGGGDAINEVNRRLKERAESFVASN